MINKLLKFFLVLLVSVNFTYAQNISDKFASATELFNKGQYFLAYELFSEIAKQSGIKEDIYSSAKYFTAESLYKLGQIDGAAAGFEAFINNYITSNYRDKALYRLGTLYFNSGQYSKCRDRLMTLVRNYPNSSFLGAADYWIGKAFIADKKYLDAEEFLLDAISASQHNNLIDYSIYTIANLYEKMGNYTNAVTYYDELLSYYRKSKLAPYAQMRIGISYFQLKEYESAVLELTDPLIKQLPDSLQTKTLYILANTYFRLKNYNKAKKIYNKILSEKPNELTKDQIQFELAWVNFQTHNYNNAYEVFISLVNSKEDSIAEKSLYWSAESKRYAGNIDEALKIYRKYLNTYPHNKIVPRVEFNIGIIFYNKGNIRKAKRYLIKSLMSDNKAAKGKSYTLLGEISLNKKDYKSAAQYFSNAVKIPALPENLTNWAILGLGISQYYLNDLKNAIMNLSDLNSRKKYFETDKVNFYLAESYFAQKNFAKAKQYYNKIPPQPGKLWKETLYGKAYAYFNLKDFPNAAFYFKEYINKYKHSSNYTDAKLRLADSYFGTKNFDLASNIYQEVFNKNKKLLNNSFEYYQYGQALFEGGERLKSIRIFKNLQLKFPRSIYADKSQYLIGWLHFQQGKYSKAIAAYSKIPVKYPRSSVVPLAYYSMGDSYYNLGKYNTAIDNYKKVLQKFPKSRYVFDAVTGIQFCFVAKNQPDSAAIFINNFIIDNPTYKFGDQILFKKGDIYYNVGNYQKAIQGFKEFIATYPNSKFVPSAYYWIGKSAENLGHEKDALFNFNKVINLYLNSDIGISAILKEGSIYSNKGDYNSAIKLYNKAIKEVPDAKDIAEVIFNKADALSKLGKLNEAAKSFNKLILYYNGTVFAAKAKIEIGLMELARGEYSNAVALFTEVAQKRTDDIGAAAQYYLGLTLFEQNKITDAISSFVRVRSIFSNYDEWYTKALIKLGDCYAKLKNKKQAREMYRAVIKRHSRDDYGKEARRKLRKL